MAETIARYTKKGNKVAVVGSVELRSYEDNEGIKRTVVDIIVQDVEFLTPKEQTGTVDDSVDDSVDRVPQKRFTNDVGRRNKPTLQAMDDDEDIPF
jgi:single-strand DNA-binding protein